MRRLVVPTDFSPFATEALRYASALAERSGAEVHVLHVVSPTAEPPATGTDTARQSLAEAADASGVTPTRAIRTSYAIAPAVLTYADEVDADTIVLGTHGRRGFRRLLLGSVAEELVRTAPVDVLVVPRSATPESGRVGRRLLVPVDLREGTDGLLRSAGELAAALGAERLDLLHVLEPLPYPVRWLDEAVLDLVPSVRDHAARELRERAEALSLDPTGVYVERGDPATIIARSADALDSDLLIVAPHEKSRLDLALLGSVAGDVARAAERPVLVARSLYAGTPLPPTEAASAS